MPASVAITQTFDPRLDIETGTWDEPARDGETPGQTLLRAAEDAAKYVRDLCDGAISTITFTDPRTAVITYTWDDGSTQVDRLTAAA